jgi:hypothetical protein
LADWSAGWNAIERGEIPAVIVDGYLVVYDMGAPWYSFTPLLFEQMVLRLDPQPGNYSVVHKALEQLAARHKCGGVIAGNAVGRKALTRAYERAGFKTIATQLHKGV